MTVATLTTENLEAKYDANARTISALKSWVNRNMSKKSRALCVEDIRQEQDLILIELMKREGVAA